MCYRHRVVFYFRDVLYSLISKENLKRKRKKSGDFNLPNKPKATTNTTAKNHKAERRGKWPRETHPNALSFDTRTETLCLLLLGPQSCHGPVPARRAPDLAPGLPVDPRALGVRR